MRITPVLNLRRIINSAYHPFETIPKPDRWLTRERLSRFTADAEQRLTAALAEHHFEYKHFRNMLDKAHILLDNIVLSQMAIYEPRTFQSLVALAKEMAIKDGRSVVPDQEFKFEVHLDDSLFGEPFPRARVYPRGAAENHKIMPRKLKPEEY
ncbi:hypothetical protein GCK32_004929 [Trichostrongylus colubriformis]|uniref:Uncharacterized protein n=1 Tax=Trichostrongylus colubriformis TaxID=6319 RepID=A0AAN8FAZ9_TRICO